MSTLKNINSTTKPLVKKEKFNFSIADLEKTSNTKNFDYNSLYNFIAKSKKLPALNLQEKKNLRKQVQNVDLNENFIAILIKSGFVADNKARSKYEQIAPQINSFLEKYEVS